MVGDNGEAWKAWLITSFLNSCCWDDVWISSCCDSCDCRCCVFLLRASNSSNIWAAVFILYLLFVKRETNVDVHLKMISFQISRKRFKVNRVSVLIDMLHWGLVYANAAYFPHNIMDSKPASCCWMILRHFLFLLSFLWDASHQWFLNLSKGLHVTSWSSRLPRAVMSACFVQNHHQTQQWSISCCCLAPGFRIWPSLAKWSVKYDQLVLNSSGQTGRSGSR